MEDVLENFLEKRELSKETIKQMKDDKIDCNIIQMMDDEQLKKYIPAFGDRVALSTFVEKQVQKDQSSKNIIDRLKLRFSKSRKRKNDEVPEKSSKLTGNTNARKQMRRVELGWLDYRHDTGDYKQVRGISGGGTRHLSVDGNFNMKDIIESGKQLFFPKGHSKRGDMDRFTFGIMGYNCNEIIDLNKTIRELYLETKLKILRLYISTKSITSEDMPTTYPDNVCSDGTTEGASSCVETTSPYKPSTLCNPDIVTSSQSSITDIVALDKSDCKGLKDSSMPVNQDFVANSSPFFPGTMMTTFTPQLEATMTSRYPVTSVSASESEIHQGFLADNEYPVISYSTNSLQSFSEYADGSDQEITFRLGSAASLNNLGEQSHYLSTIPTSYSTHLSTTNGNVDVTQGPTPNDESFCIQIRRGYALDDLKSAFIQNPSLIDTHLNVKVLEPNGKCENGEGVGVLRDVVTEFWQTFYERCTLGNCEKVPYIRHDFQEKDWRAIAQIFVKGWIETEYLPLQIAEPFIDEVIGENVTEENLLDSFFQYLATSEKDVIKTALDEFQAVDKGDLLEVLDAYNCKRNPTKENLKDILQQIAHKELIQAPMFVIDCWRPVIRQFKCALSHEKLSSLRKTRDPNQKNIIKQLIFPETMSHTEQDISKYLVKYLKESSRDNLQKFLRFCTGSDIILGQKITVNFVEMKDFERRPMSTTCNNMLQLANSYSSFPEFRAEFNSTLQSSVWSMDFV